MTGFPQPAPRRIALAAALLALIAIPGRAADLTHRSGAMDKNAPIVFQADEVQNDDQLGLTVARGHVEISQNNQVLLADTITYNQHTDTVTASGHVSLLEPTGEVVFAEFMELRDSMNNGFATEVRMLLSDRSRLAANTARRVNGNRIQLPGASIRPATCARATRQSPRLGKSRRARSTTTRRGRSSSSATRSSMSTGGRSFIRHTCRPRTLRSSAPADF